MNINEYFSAAAFSASRDIVFWRERMSVAHPDDLIVINHWAALEEARIINLANNIMSRLENVS